MERETRISAKALIIRDGKMLAVKLDDNGDVYYIMPGGGLHAEETLTDALRREVAEELGIEVAPTSLEFVIEGVHGEPFHRVDMVFLCDYVGSAGNTAPHWDKNQVAGEWLDIDGLVLSPLYPSRLREQIVLLYHGIETQVYLGNEEVGDPEWPHQRCAR